MPLPTSPLPLLRPSWCTPPGVAAAMSERGGGVSHAPWDSLNLGGGVGDDAAAVAHNRALFAGTIGATPRWLHQVHGCEVVELRADTDPAALAAADAAWSVQRGVVCAVLVADCLPVLLASRDGRAVAAAHAGWRGLAAGVLESTLQALAEGAGVAPDELRVWLGPCIGPRHFEVGADVLLAFSADPQRPHAHFVSRPRADGTPRWLANLPQLARDRLTAAGVPDIHVDGACTFEQASRFFSFRRSGRTGRHAAAIWRI